MTYKENAHYSLMGEDFLCLKCKRKFPQRYAVLRKKSNKEYGTKQLMSLWAWYNFERHLSKCHKPVKGEKEADEMWECPSCEYLISNDEFQTFEYNYGCPRCGRSFARFSYCHKPVKGEEG